MKQERQYKEFKPNAARLYLADKDSKSIKAIVEDLGISRAPLGRRVTQYRSEGEKSFVGSGYVVNREMKDHKRELRLVKQERDILKKAVAGFSNPVNKGTNL